MRERELSVSVAMCTYNGGPYIEEQLESILRQTVQPCELVANDDGSSDDTVEILREFASRAPFPVLIEENPSNLGPTKNFERSMGRCRGDVVVISDCDDIFVPRKNEIIRDALMADPDLGCVFGDAKLIRSDGSPLGLTLWDSIEFGNEDQERFDHGDIVASCVAPRPFMAVAPADDVDMPRAAVDDFIRIVTPAYSDRHGHFVVRQPPGDHYFTVEYFEWMVAWFDRFLRGV